MPTSKPINIPNDNSTYEEICAYKKARDEYYHSGTMIHRFIRNNDISTDIKKIKDTDILDVKLTDIDCKDEKTGCCISAIDNAKATSNVQKDISGMTLDDVCKKLYADGWKLFSSTKVE
jgi:hypothetical protein